jgi:hypothetical protein
MVVNDNYETDIDVQAASRPLTMLSGSDTVTIIATGTDNDGGLRAIRLWAAYTYYNPGQTVGPTLPGVPVRQVVSNAQVGESTAKTRFFFHNLDLDAIRGSWARIRIDVWTEAENFHGGTSQSSTVSIRYPAAQAGDTLYMAECRRRNVPIPPDWAFAGSAWDYQGNLSTNINHPGDDALIWTHTDELRGACMAIARRGVTDAAGIICQSAITGSACFWERIRRSDGSVIDWQDGEEMIITEVQDGSDVVENCTECHRGNNVFLMAPDDPVWANVLRGPLSTAPDSTFTTRIEWSKRERDGHPRYTPVTLVSRPAWQNPFQAGGCAGACHENAVFAQTLTPPPMPPACASSGDVEDCYR